MIEASENGRVNVSVKKEDIIRYPGYIIIYNELIAQGILYEYSIPDSYLTISTYVKFSDNNLFEYFLANKWIKENGLNDRLIEKVVGFYELTPQRLCNILKYILKIACKEENTDFLKEIWSIFHERVEIVCPLNFHRSEFINTLGLELRKNRKLRTILLPGYAQSKQGQELYYEAFGDIDCLVLYSGDSYDYYLQHNSTNYALYYGHFMKFMQFFLANNSLKCKEEYEIVHGLEYSDEMELDCLGFYNYVHLVYYSVFSKEPIDNLMNHVYQLSEKLSETNLQTNSLYSRFEFLIIFALDFGNKFDEIIELTDRFAEKYNVTQMKSSAFYLLARAIYARALLNTGKFKQANELFNQIKLDDIHIPVNMRHYIKLRLQFIKVEFLFFKGENKKAKKILNEIKSISQMLQYDYFFEKADTFSINKSANIDLFNLRKAK